MSLHNAERSSSNMKLGVFSYQFFLRFSPSVRAKAFWWMEWMHVVRSSQCRNRLYWWVQVKTQPYVHDSNLC